MQQVKAYLPNSGGKSGLWSRDFGPEILRRWETKSVVDSGFFLKELYVASAARGSGIGRALMRALAELAMARGHKRLDWTADAANPDLLGFYEGLGAVAQREKAFYRLAGEALSGLARTEV